MYLYGHTSSKYEKYIHILFPDWLKAAQAFGTLALFALLGAIGVCAMYAFVPDFSGDMKILGANFAAIGVTCKLT